jgi:UDP-2,3-diacylglucosamine pyrophosphatase LpxH
MAYRAMFVSDVHLYQEGCQISKLVEMLTTEGYERLYLVGDILDFWVTPVLDDNPEYAAWSMELMRVLTDVALRVPVYYVAGNHDSVMRNFIGAEFVGIKVVDQASYTCSAGIRYLVTHGDKYDASVRWPWLPVIGTWLMKWLCQHFSMSEFLDSFNNKKAAKVKFNEVALNDVVSKGYDGIICGHTHIPEIVEGYVNAGDWLENCTYVVDGENGLELHHWE